MVWKLWRSVSGSWWRSVSGRLVASGCWWWQECHHYRGWVDFFLHLEEGGLPYASTARLICFLFLRQGIRCHRCHGPREASFFQGTPLLLLLVDFLAPRSMWVVVAWLILFVVFVARQQPWPLLHAATMLIVFFFSWNSTMARSLLPLTCSLLHGQCLLCSGAKKFWLIFWLLQSPVICQF